MNDNQDQEEKNQPITILQQSAITEDNIDVAMRNAEKFAKALDRMRQLALMSTSISDWRDENGKPYLMWTGASKVARTFGVSFNLSQLNFSRTTFSDELGEGVRIRVLGNVKWNGSEVAEIGACSSRDDFFGKRTKDKIKIYLPLSEIDETDLEKKALTNWLNRGLKSMLGLSFTWEEIAQITAGKITLDKIQKAGQSTHYTQGKQGGTSESSDISEMREKTKIMISDMSEGNKEEEKTYLKSVSGFQAKDGSAVPGVDDVSQLSEGRLKVVNQKTKRDYTEWLKTEYVISNPDIATFSLDANGSIVKRTKTTQPTTQVKS